MSKKTVSILGANSAPNRITIYSDEYISTSRWEDGCVNTSVKKLSRIAKLIFTLKKYPIPRLTIFCTSLLFAFSKKRLVSGSLLLSVYLVLTYMYGMSFTSNTGIIEEHVALLVSVGCIMFAIRFYVYYKKIATWHGAEHMTCNSYWHNGKTDLDSISKESTFSPRCGGRYLTPLVLIMLSSTLLEMYTGINAVIFLLLGWEIMLWIDTFWGIDKIPVFSGASRLLQTHITTKQPGDKELATAQSAIEAVLHAHNTESF